MQSHIPFATPGWISLSATWIRATEASSDGETEPQVSFLLIQLNLELKLTPAKLTSLHQVVHGSGPCGPASGLHLP